MQTVSSAIVAMKNRIVSILDNCFPSIYLYGSVSLNDFKLGWSDIDILVITETPISEAQANQLVPLREVMSKEEPDNPYYRSFESGMLTLDTFLQKKADCVVYWGTSNERITDHYDFDAFCMAELIDNGILIHGKDVRARLPHPTFEQLKSNVQSHYETIRRYAVMPKRSIHSFGWLLDISRCIYTLRTGKIISKTEAGEWALEEKLCPCKDALIKAVKVRKSPAQYKQDSALLDDAEMLGNSIQAYADKLEQELKKQVPPSSV